MTNPTSCCQCLHRNPGWLAKGLLMLAKGMTPDSGGRKRPFSRSRLSYHSVLPQCPLVCIYRKVVTAENLQPVYQKKSRFACTRSGRNRRVMMTFPLFAPSSKKWLGWRKTENALRGRLGYWFCDTYYLTNRFHVAVSLLSNRSQMTSKCVKDKEVAQEPQASVPRYCTEPTGFTK